MTNDQIMARGEEMQRLLSARVTSDLDKVTVDGLYLTRRCSWLDENFEKNGGIKGRQLGNSWKNGLLAKKNNNNKIKKNL